MEDFFEYRCTNCKHEQLRKFTNFWSCPNCKTNYELLEGIPKFYSKSKIKSHDRKLKKALYEGLMGKYYSFIVPFIQLPVRPIKISLVHWGGLFLSYLVLGFAIYFSVQNFLVGNYVSGLLFSVLALIFLTILAKNRYILHLLIVAIPAKISFSMNKYVPKYSMKEIHDKFQQNWGDKSSIKVLDVSTGTSDMLLRHGWTSMNADITGIDISETMLFQGKKFMSKNNVKMNFALCDVYDLPFKDETFDVVLNHGAINAYSDISSALQEMTRVLKKDGEMMLLDEQLYNNSSAIERYYFKKVLSSHDIVDHCPIEFFPENLKIIENFQVYECYYVCTAKKVS